MKRLLSGFLALALVAMLLPVSALAATDIDSHWAKEIFLYLDEKGVINPGQNGTAYTPDATITRAEFMRYLNRAFDFTEMADISQYTDVPADTWYYDQVRIAVHYGYINGTSATNMSPTSTLTREQAATIIGRLHKGDLQDSSALAFTDKSTISSWALPYIGEAEQMGYIRGYPDGTFRPQRSITRAEIAQIIYRFGGTLLDSAGSYTAADLRGDVSNVTLSQGGVSLSDVTIPGNLYITEGVGAGAITLSGVTVRGKIVLSGGTVSLNNVTADEMIVSSAVATPYVSVTGETNIRQTVVRTGAALAETALSATAGGFADLLLNGDKAISLSVSGQIRTLTTASAGQINLLSGSSVQTAVLGAATTISGTGTVEKAQVYVFGCVFATMPLSYDITSGVTAQAQGVTIAGTSDSTVGLSTYRFDRYAAGRSGEYADVVLTVRSSALVVRTVTARSRELAYGDGYTVSGQQVTLKKEALADLAVGTCPITVAFTDGTAMTLNLTIYDSSTNRIDVTSAQYDKYVGGGIPVQLSLPLGVLFQSVQYNNTDLVETRDYTVSGDTITLTDYFLQQRSVGTFTVTFVMTSGNKPTLSITVTDSSPVNALEPAILSFDRNPNGVAYDDVTTTLTLVDGAELTAVRRGTSELSEVLDYVYDAATGKLTVKKSYLDAVQQVSGTYVQLTMITSKGARPVLRINYITTYDTTIYVQDELGQPVAGAQVSLGGYTVATNDQGRATLAVANGVYALSISAEGYETLQEQNVTAGDGERTLRYTLTQVNGLTVSVTNVSGAPASGALVTLGDQSVTTGSDGRASFVTRAGTYRLTVTHSLYGSYETTVAVNGYGSHQVVLGGSAVSYPAVIRVVNVSGQAVSGATVTVNGQSLTTTAAGTATFQLANGTYPVTARTAAVSATGTLTVSNAAAVLVLTLR